MAARVHLKCIGNSCASSQYVDALHWHSSRLVQNKLRVCMIARHKDDRIARTNESERSHRLVVISITGQFIHLRGGENVYSTLLPFEEMY